MSLTARKWLFLIILSYSIATSACALSDEGFSPGQVSQNFYTEVDYELACGLPFQQNCGIYSPANGCQKMNCFPYLEYDNEFGIAVDVNGGMRFVFSFCSQNTENCVPAHLGRTSKCCL